MVKFRAWHIKEKKMCEIEVISFARSGKVKGAFLIGAEPGKDTYTAEREIIYAPTHGRYCTMGEFILLQYTGLMDFYEGDIIETYDGTWVIKKNTNHGLRFLVGERQLTFEDSKAKLIQSFDNGITVIKP